MAMLSRWDSEYPIPRRRQHSNAKLGQLYLRPDDCADDAQLLRCLRINVRLNSTPNERQMLLVEVYLRRSLPPAWQA